MGLSTALYAGISGLERQQANLNVIGSNIANANTYGYKSQRVLFNDMLYNTIKSSTAPTGTSAGTNGSQIGSGVDISVVDTNFNDGEIETTGIATDLAVEGNGFFVLSDGGQQVFTRDGAFSLSQDRRLVNGATGMSVQGWNQTRDNAGNSTVNAGGAISDITIPVGDNRVARATSEVIFNGNLNNDGDIATTGSILNSQRLFSSTSDVEVTSGAIDMKDVYIKDPSGGVDNVRLFAGSGSADGDSGVLTTGDQVTVQLMKGDRPLEAIFVYGNSDVVSNTDGTLGPDNTPDVGKESYDGTTLDDFLNWFDSAFGLHAVEDTGVSADSNAAHGADGDNPNDLVDMGLDESKTPFTDATDSEGFEFVMTLGGDSGLEPVVAYNGGNDTFKVIGGSSSDVGQGSSFIDIDEDGLYNSAQDIALTDTASYVMNSKGSVAQGYQDPTSSTPLMVRAFNDAAGTGIGNAKMAFIDVDGSLEYNKDSDILIQSENDFVTADVGVSATSTLTVSSDTNVVTSAAGDFASGEVEVGHFFYANGETYYVSDVEYSATTTITTITLDNSNGLAAADTLANMTFNVSNLTTLGYTASTSSAVGTTVASTLNLPKGQKVDNKYQGMAITETMTDNEAGRAGSIFTGGDATMRIVAATEDGTASEFTYIDADGDGELSEKVYRVGHDGTDLFIDFDGDDSGAAAVQSTGDGTIATSQLESLSAYADDEKVYTDASGNVYRKVPKIYDSSETSVYLDDHNKGVYDEVRYGIAKSIDTTGDGAGDTILDRDGDGAADLYVVDENGDGLVSAGENIVISTQTDTSGDLTTVTDVSSSDTATLERADASIINGDSSGSGRIQIRGNIGTENEISGISFISGTNVVERTIFASSALADADGHGYSIESTANGESVSQNIVVYDSLGKSHDVNMTFVLETKDNDTATWRWFAESPDVTQSEGIFPVGDPRGVSPSVNVGSGTVKFDNFGRYLSSTGATTNSEAMLHIPLEGSNTDSALAIKPDFSILTAFASSTGSEVDVREQDGFAQGVMDRFTVNADGTVTGIYTNGMTEVVAQVALAAFANPDGLTRSGGNLFTVGSNSGNAMIGEAGTGERGAIRGEALELSNVDITDEFTKMIVAQRSYQANARVVTKSDELLQELMQIIR